jgi:hypothetical protein
MERQLRDLAGLLLAVLLVAVAAAVVAPRHDDDRCPADMVLQVSSSWNGLHGREDVGLTAHGTRPLTNAERALVACYLRHLQQGGPG